MEQKFLKTKSGEFRSHKLLEINQEIQRDS